jgi:uncharacterized protein with ATP-grasp and redox domains
MQQALRASKVTDCDDELTHKILAETGKMIADIPLESTPPETGRLIYQKVSELTNIQDPYHEIKQKNIMQVQQLYPELKKIINESENPLLTAVRLAIAGNVIDLGVNREFDILLAIEEILIQDFAYNDFDKFSLAVAEAENILYLADNSAEAVFDKLLIEQMGNHLIFAVKEKPIINDATLKEAKQIGISEIAEVISSGSDAPGTILDLCNEDFLEIFKNADLIISKGQGNFEGLSNVNAPIFFLLRAKCPVIAKELGVEVDSIILKSQE